MVQENTLAHVNDDEVRGKVENYLTVVNKQPKQSKILQNKFANNSDYLPIEHIELKMDELFMGLWKSRLTSPVSIQGNAVVANVEVDFYHPVVNIWLTRCGTGAISIQIDSKTGMAQNKALEKAVGAAKTQAFKNAVKSIGKSFGRDLNRKHEDVYERKYTTIPSNKEALEG